MIIIKTAEESLTNLSADITHYTYNGLDACITLQVLHKLQEQKLPHVEKPYTLERALQAPVLEMMLRGIAVNSTARTMLIKSLENESAQLQEQLNTLAYAAWGEALNANSHIQVKKFFYEFWSLPTQYAFVAGKRKISSDKDALEKLNAYKQVRPFISHILAIKERRKMLGVLRSKIDKDNRMRASFNIGGTETGRWSSSSGAYGGGTNLQNITESLRRIFWADPGYKLAYVDLEQAESRAVAGLVLMATGDESYLKACESSDLHTTVTRLIWPDLGWTGNSASDKKIAKQDFYSHYSYRDMAKRAGHGTNYYGTPPTMAKHLKIDVAPVRNFQNAYFEAFPGIPLWHKKVAQELQTNGFLQTPFGRGRHFFDRLTSDVTLREAIAFVPQSTIADYLNTGLLEVWRQMPQVQLLAQVHDAILFQYPEELENEIIPQVMQLLSFPLAFGDVQLTIPTETVVGWNWSYASETNPDGLKDWCGSDARERKENPQASLLDRLIL